ncbi:F-box/kelch-repeat protein At1g57790-like [Macadamia integrifolia]|uniref:F-box/kelch-repeat protein At1g57790-like n=1 Tax=Macadamia integrifolia TaxID=60698 RepID=UPI001C533C56|nr:F-box/kelch-repeat protein At1g57790-like [Macadamia integrifolia]
MAKATAKETREEEVINQDQPEARSAPWYLLGVCKNAFFHLYQYICQQKKISSSITHQRKTEESSSSSNWSDDLPEELLGFFRLCLFGQDYCTFRAVCRTWRSNKGNPFPILHTTPPTTDQSLLPMTQFPWLLYLKEEDHVLNVFHPLCKGSTLIEIPGLLSDSRICSSSNGWFLLWQYSRRLFFLNPFTKSVIELPDFPRDQWDFVNHLLDMHLPALSFTSPPTSSNCIVFGISSSCSADRVSICIIRHGEPNWTIHKCLPNNLPFVLSNANPVFHKGLVYCLGEGGNLGVFDPHKGTRDGECNWTVLAKPLAPSFVSTIPDGNRSLVQCNGNLISVFQDHMGKGVSVFSLDQQRMIWNQVQDLNDHMLFLTSQTSHSAKVVNPFNGMGDKIYFPIFLFSSCNSSSSNDGGGFNSCVFYSLCSEMYHTFGTSHSSRDISRMKIQINCAWIEPNFVIPSSKDLKWGLK